MKTILFILLCSVSAIGQTYTTKMGNVVNVGDTLMCVKGSGVNGQYLHISVGGWGSVAGAQVYLAQQLDGGKLLVKKIKRYKHMGVERVALIVGAGNITNYVVEIDQAEQSKEVIW
jgi:hypothetical protein